MGMWSDGTAAPLALWLWQPHCGIATGTEDVGIAGRSPHGGWRAIDAFPAMENGKASEQGQAMGRGAGDAEENREINPMEQDQTGLASDVGRGHVEREAKGKNS